MSKLTSIIELRKMQIKDLQGEVNAQEHLVSKLRLGVKLNKEKNSAKYKGEKKQLARMNTVLTEKQTEKLLMEESKSTVSAPSKALAAKTDSPTKQS